MPNKIAVIGAGTMGAGIAQIAAEAGYRVALVDADAKNLERGIGHISRFVHRKVEKGQISEDQQKVILANLHGTTQLEKALEDVTMVIEAVFEKLDLKRRIFMQLDAICPRHVILASNTSTLMISDLASAVQHQERVIGTHFFSPVPLMRLVEIIRGEKTSDSTMEKTVELCRNFGKTPIIVNDIPGFIVNRFLCLIYNEAANMIENGLARAEDIDTALKLGCNWPMGINEVADLAGIDVTYFAIKAMYDMTGEDRYKPSPLFERMIRENRLGRKSGKGFYHYTQS